MTIDIRPVIEQYDASCQPTAIEYLAGAGGFSGSRFWRLTTPRGTLALRQYAPELTDIPTLSNIWMSLSAASRQSLGYRLPLAIMNREQLPFVEHRRRLWDLCDWLPGQAVPEGQATAMHVAHALLALAKFHAFLDRLYPEARRRGLRSMAVQTRILRIETLRDGQAAQIVEHVAAAKRRSSFWTDTAATLADRFRQEAVGLQRALADPRLQTPYSMTIGDVWRDNVLFDDAANVTALLDLSRFEADSTATDIARLLGSLIVGHPEWWQVGIEAYVSIRPLEAEEQQLAVLLDRANVLLSAWNWLLWLFVEQRKFDNLNAIEARVRHFLARLPEVFGA